MSGILRLQYSIGSRTLSDILPYLWQEVDRDDVVVATTQGRTGTDAIIISRTEIGKSWMTFFAIKNSGNPLVSFKECK